MSLVFFTDRDLSTKVFPGELAAKGIHVERHADHFTQDAPDAEWIPEVAKRGWVIVSANTDMTRRSLEVDAIMRSGARVLLLVGGHQPVRVLAQNFINTRTRIERYLQRREGALIVKVSRPSGESAVAKGEPGHVRLHLDEASWAKRRQA